MPVVVDGCRRRCLGAVTAALNALDRDTALFDPLSEGDRPGGPHYGRPRPVSRYTTGVTDRKERERELERQKDPFSKAEDLAAVVAWEHDLGSDNLYWTDQVYEIHGCSDDFEPSIERVAEWYYERHHIPTDERLYELENFPEFVSAREEMLRNQILETFEQV